jgi:hypothetical protein
MNLKVSPENTSEEYVVKFWYTNQEGYARQAKESFFCNSKVAHKRVEVFAKTYLKSVGYTGIQIINVTYQ